jgi:hypothetical protein
MEVPLMQQAVPDVLARIVEHKRVDSTGYWARARNWARRGKRTRRTPRVSRRAERRGWR